MNEEKRVPNTIEKEERIKTDKNKAPELMSYKDVRIDYTEKPHDDRKIVKIMFLIIFLGIIFSACHLYESNNKNVFRDGIKTSIYAVEQKAYEIRGSKFREYNLKKIFRTSFILSNVTSFHEDKVSEEEKAFLEMINDITGSFTIDYNYPQKKAAYSLKSTVKGDNLLEVFGNIEEDGFSYKVKNVLGKYAYEKHSNLKRFFIDSNTDNKDLDAIKNEVYLKLFNNIKESELTRKTITLDGVKVKDVSFTLDNASLKALFNETLNDLIDDDKFIQATMNYTNLTQTRLEEILRDYQKEFMELQIEDHFTIHIYAKGFFHKFVGFRIESDSTSIYYVKQSKKTNISIKQDGKEVFTYESLKIDDTLTKYIMEVNNTKVEFSKLLKKGAILYDYTLKKEKDNYTGSILIDDREDTSKEGTIRISLTKQDINFEDRWTLNTTINYSVKATSAFNLYGDTDRIEINQDTKNEVLKRIRNSKNISKLRELYQNQKAKD